MFQPYHIECFQEDIPVESTCVLSLGVSQIDLFLKEDFFLFLSLFISFLVCFFFLFLNLFSFILVMKGVGNKDKGLALKAGAEGEEMMKRVNQVMVVGVVEAEDMDANCYLQVKGHRNVMETK